MRSIFEPLGWAVRKLDKDNGIDFEIEIFDNFKSTGVFFKVQLKSSGRTQYSSSKDFISQAIKIHNARYLCNEVRLPVVLIHADISNGRTFWLAPQLITNDLLQQIIAPKNKGISIRIPTSNELSGTINKLIETITRVEQVLASRLIISTPVLSYVESVTQHIDEDQLTQEFQNKGDAIKLNQAHQLCQSGRYSEAINKAQRVFSNSESSTLNKFFSLIQIERAELMAAMRSPTPQENYPLIKLKIGRQFRELTKKGPPHLKLYAIIAWEAAKLEILTQRYHGLLLNWVAHRKGNNAVWKAQLVFERTRLYRQILFKYNQCIKLANHSTRLNDWRGIPDALMRIVDAISRFITNLTSENLDESADRYSASALQICKLAAHMAMSPRNDENLYTVATKALSTKRATTGEAVDFALSTIDKIQDEQTKRKTQELFDLAIRTYRGEKTEGAVKSTYRQIYENMASALGINLSNPDDPISQLVQLGLNDLDPTRILVNCEHIFITMGAQGMVAEILDMPTAGHKVLRCDLHECAIEGLSLDNTYHLFKQRFCTKCSDCSPRPSTWKHSEKWQEEENKRHLEYMKRFAKRIGIVLVNGEE